MGQNKVFIFRKLGPFTTIFVKCQKYAKMGGKNEGIRYKF